MRLVLKEASLLCSLHREIQIGCISSIIKRRRKIQNCVEGLIWHLTAHWIFLLSEYRDVESTNWTWFTRNRLPAENSYTLCLIWESTLTFYRFINVLPHCIYYRMYVLCVLVYACQPICTATPPFSMEIVDSSLTYFIHPLANGKSSVCL